MTTDRTEQGVRSTVIDRRTVMKAVGATTIGLTGLAGTASATGTNGSFNYEFYGCSQVCTDKKHVKAVVWTGDEFRLAPITRSSNRNDPPVRDWDKVYCYEVKDGHAIVGICFDGEFTANPNRCARNYPAPKSCGDCNT